MSGRDFSDSNSYHWTNAEPGIHRVSFAQPPDHASDAPRQELAFTGSDWSRSGTFSTDRKTACSNTDGQAACEAATEMVEVRSGVHERA